jgi:large subunit ribosomal protein L25
MDTKSLTVELRDSRGKGVARKLRAAGRIPGVVYGEGQEARPVVLDRKGFDQLMRIGAHHGLLDLSFESGHEPVKALVREIQVHPVTREVEHVDLQRVSMKEKIRIEVPIVLVGKPEGVRNQGGILEHNLRNVEIECLPSAIPQQIEVDVNDLTIGKSIHVSDLQMPGVVFLAHPETSIATVSVPAAERAQEDAAAVAAAEAAAATATPVEGEAKPGDKAEAKPGEKAKPTKEKDTKGGKS